MLFEVLGATTAEDEDDEMAADPIDLEDGPAFDEDDQVLRALLLMLQQRRGLFWPDPRRGNPQVGPPAGQRLAGGASLRMFEVFPISII